MKKIYCDVCKKEIHGSSLKIQFRDGEHPHNGSICYKDCDVCLDCACNIQLYCHEDINDIDLENY